MNVLIVGLNYAPEPIGIGPYTTGMAEYFAGCGHDVEAVAGRAYYPNWRAYPGHRGFLWRRGRERGIGITRCWHYVPPVPRAIKRILHHFSFFLTSLPVVMWRALRDRPDIIICVAPSIMSAIVAQLGATFGRSKVWLHLQDFEVDAAFAAGAVRGDRLARFLLAVERRVLLSQAMVSSISPQMVALLIAKDVPPERTYLLRNWANALPGQGGELGFRQAWDLGQRKVVLYSGNIAWKQGAGLIIEAAERLAHRDDLVFVICGAGPELAPLKAQAECLGNVRFHPLQPPERLMELLELATLHLLPQVDAAADLVLPSKLTNMLLSGRPVIATTLPGTGLYAEVEGCGLAIPPGDADALSRPSSGSPTTRRWPQHWATLPAPAPPSTGRARRSSAASSSVSRRSPTRADPHAAQHNFGWQSNGVALKVTALFDPPAPSGAISQRADTAMKRSECMVCSGNRLVEFIDLGDQPNGNNFLPADQVGNKVSFPLAMMVCQDCWEVQISEFPPQEVLFSDHPYLSGVNAPVVAHFEQLAARVVYKLGLKQNDLVIDVGCNDGTLLKMFAKQGLRTLGVDPSERPGQVAREQGMTVFKQFWNGNTGRSLR